MQVWFFLHGSKILPISGILKFDKEPWSGFCQLTCLTFHWGHISVKHSILGFFSLYEVLIRCILPLSFLAFVPSFIKISNQIFKCLISHFWRRQWQPTPVFLPGESQGWGSLVGCRLWYGVTQSRTRLKWLSSSSSNITFLITNNSSFFSESLFLLQNYFTEPIPSPIWDKQKQPTEVICPLPAWSSSCFLPIILALVHGVPEVAVTLSHLIQY